jgi:hypothetical protein
MQHSQLMPKHRDLHGIRMRSRTTAQHTQNPPNDHHRDRVNHHGAEPADPHLPWPEPSPGSGTPHGLAVRRRGRAAGRRLRPGRAGRTTVSTPDRDSYEFNTSGELTAMTLGDPGHRIVVARSGGQVSRVTGVSSRYLAYHRSSGYLDDVTDGTRTVNLTYTGARLTAASGVDARTEHY